ncbi:hydroxymethylpyrimidine kinase / phosphohydroxymethylpyrimidine kinase [Campylobacter blaseri]|uniref:hydroxymethylpyrimidine kinase n=1 Tax=Campylobacter blaseri TaxID=2042961 RepID=A0A2P8R3X2_9BACT|nr:bifunctional hydroxymethylpyrimidine kinase/phosphomethylpyrimidine kinase [Campylobacter blaseri]PSM53217.1 bifunctional hydroxymethylpyrimidine kinase/phosphomethylpyrimidine kinase [Campylobacter blaseri]PSM54683.1 bifunctional hydroxymethylpyrimidine kinase/phosphomethylpyrimidine kinase [Campylobacter blaseri]QKF86837.1 hydroxymethylpyrimidine kinase / phosphohydroxymethylpyrimidine kinase [Campylobacter blaseri]
MKVLLSIAGSDSSGGAGIQADIKTAEYFKIFSTTALTALTAQNTMGVKEIVNISPSFVKAQIDTVKEDFQISAVKIGMLFNKEIIDVVEDFIKYLDIPIVIDPVFISKAGSTLMSDENIKYMKNLFKYATILTPNLYEAKVLFGDDLNVIAPCNVVIKNIKENDFSIDRLFYKNGNIKEFKNEFINTENLHGTGCSFSTAIACNLALGNSLENSVKISKEFITKAIKNAPNLGHGKGPILHNLNDL